MGWLYNSLEETRRHARLTAEVTHNHPEGIKGAEAVSLGGDCDTLTCIAASIAEAFYGLPDNMMGDCRKRLPKDMLRILDRFDERRSDRR